MDLIMLKQRYTESPTMSKFIVWETCSNVRQVVLSCMMPKSHLKTFEGGTTVKIFFKNTGICMCLSQFL